MIKKIKYLLSQLLKFREPKQPHHDITMIVRWIDESECYKSIKATQQWIIWLKHKYTALADIDQICEGLERKRKDKLQAIRLRKLNQIRQEVFIHDRIFEN